MTVGWDQMSISEIAAPLEAELVALRRDIHRWPELAGQERRTAALVADRLRAEGLDVSTGVGGHGVVATLDGAAPGPTLAYRADMDAVDDDELFAGDFASRTPGAAHLCGHDLHTAIGVGVAQVLARMKHALSGRVVFVFQPAEETLTGARAMLADGALEHRMPGEIYALHCAPLPVGTFGIMPGYGLPGLDQFDIEVSGPDAGRRAERLAAAVESLSTVAYPQDPQAFAGLLADLQTPDGRLARFVFARTAVTVQGERATVRVWLRTWPDDRYGDLREQVRHLTASVDGARIAFPPRPFPAMVCSPELSEAAGDHLRATLGTEAVVRLHASFPFNGEDFALFLQQVPGAMVFLGVANPDAGRNGVPHAPDFAADERAILLAVRAMAGLLAERLGAAAAAA